MTLEQVLQELVPLNALSGEGFAEAVRATRVERPGRGSVLFRRGDTDNDAIYLLEGSIALASDDRDDNPRSISAGSDEARYAVAQLKPRQVTGILQRDSVIARIDNDRLDRLLTMDQVSGIEVVEMELDDDVDWIFRVLSSTTFNRLPAENANQMLARMERLAVRANQVIITQGEPGDYYYLIREGVASVAQRGEDGKVHIVNELAAGDQFGEEALLSDAPRNATIMMKTDGLLMRLAKQDFTELLRAPLIDWIEQDEADRMIGLGAGILDVRTEGEYRSGAIKLSQNVPLARLREHLDRLERDKPYVIYCQTGSRSAVAAFMLNQRGFQTYALKGGLNNLVPTSAAAAASSG